MNKLSFAWALLASPLALIVMLAGGLVGPPGVLIAPQIPWALFTWLDRWQRNMLCQNRNE